MIEAPAEAAARAAIADVLALYCHAIDRRQWHLLEACFTPDATYSFSSIRGTWREFAASAQALIEPLASTHHQLGQTLYAIAGDEAATETYMTAMHHVPADAPRGTSFPGRGEDYQAVVAGRYVDRFVRVGQDWRIARRTGIVDWRSQTPLPADRAVPRLGESDDPAIAISRTLLARE